jgi:hypothetical protein
MKRLPITHKAKQSSSPLKFDYKFTKSVADQVAASKEFIAAGDAIGVGIDSAERRIARQQTQAANTRAEKEASGGNGPNMQPFEKEAGKVTESAFTTNSASKAIDNTKKSGQSEEYKKFGGSKGGYKLGLSGGKSLAMGSNGVSEV